MLYLTKLLKRMTKIWHASLGGQFGTLASQSECDASGTPLIVARVHLQVEKQMCKVCRTRDPYLHIMVPIYNYAHRYVLMLTDFPFYAVCAIEKLVTDS